MPDLSFLVLLGLNLGGTMPLPIPGNITKVESYSPGLAPSIGIDAINQLSEKAGVSAGLRLENKSMKSTASVKEYSMNFRDFRGRFSGTVDTEMNFNYLSLPILARYTLTENFAVYAGAYYAYLLSGKFKGAANDGLLNSGSAPLEVIREEYDFSNELRNHDIGLNLGLNFLPYNERFMVCFDFNYGFLSVFPKDFTGISDDMQNIYGRLSVGYLF